MLVPAAAFIVLLAHMPPSRPAAPDLRQAIRVAVAHLVPPAARANQPPPPARDSVKNGVIIGTIAGGAYGATFVALAGDELSTSGKVGVLWTSAAMGAGLGWLIDRMK